MTWRGKKADEGIIFFEKLTNRITCSKSQEIQLMKYGNIILKFMKMLKLESHAVLDFSLNLYLFDFIIKNLICRINDILIIVKQILKTF